MDDEQWSDSHIPLMLSSRPKHSTQQRFFDMSFRNKPEQLGDLRPVDQECSLLKLSSGIWFEDVWLQAWQSSPTEQHNLLNCIITLHVTHYSKYITTDHLSLFITPCMHDPCSKRRKDTCSLIACVTAAVCNVRTTCRNTTDLRNELVFIKSNDYPCALTCLCYGLPEV